MQNISTTPRSSPVPPFPVNSLLLPEANNVLISITRSRVIPITQSVNYVLLVPLSL